MLRKETVSESTLELLKALMKDEWLKDFFLVDGTALALQMGHRVSLDIDLFAKTAFNSNELLSKLEENYQFKMDFRAKTL